MKNKIKMKNRQIILFTLLSLTAIAVFMLIGGDLHTAGLMLAVTPVATPIKNELAEREMIKKFRHENTWLTEIRSKPQWVNKDVIKIPIQGLAPKVLINNKVYPIVSKERKDTHILLGLNKYDTENTKVTDDELYALPYEKISDVQQQHREELEDKTAEHALYSISPAAASTQVPLLKTTGADDGTGRLRMTAIDLIKFKNTLDNLGVPKPGRVLVLCSNHVADLLVGDLTFKNQYQNHTTGEICKQYYGFKVYESTYTPLYDDKLKKTAFDAATPTGNAASVAFHKRTTVKATGSVQRYVSLAAQNPEYRESTMGFRLHFICVAIQDLGCGALVSGKKSS